jgi:hypothetical protein
MSETSAAIEPAPSSPGAPLEQQLYLHSPFGALVTTAILVVLMFGSFLILAALEHVPTIWRVAKGIAISGAAWPAMVLSLLCSAALGMQRYARLREAADAPAYARILTGGVASAASVTGLTARGTRLVRSTIIGIVVGFALSAAVVVSENREGHPIQAGPLVWYVCAITLLSVLFARGVEQTRAGGRAYAGVLDAELKIDLLRIDTLAVLGRSAARSSLTWFVVSAVACLFFVGGDLNWLTIALIASCVTMGVGMFASTMVRIHRQIKGAKDAELEHVRRQIDAMRATMHEDSTAAARLHGMLAYEKRISDAQEWPFDQSTLVRVAAYVLIPTIPWFGQAAVQYYVDHLGH